MFKTNDLQRTVTAAVGALLVSFAFIGAAVGPARAAELQAVNTPQSAVGSQSVTG